VVDRAQALLAELEAGDRLKPMAEIVNDLPLFAARPAQAPAAPAREEPLRAALDALEPDEMSPREALEALYALKRLPRGG